MNGSILSPCHSLLMLNHKNVFFSSSGRVLLVDCRWRVPCWYVGSGSGEMADFRAHLVSVAWEASFLDFSEPHRRRGLLCVFLASLPLRIQGTCH